MFLEAEPRLQLRDASRAGAVDLAEIGRGDIGLNRRIVDPVQCVQDVASKLDASRPSDRERLAHR